MGNETGMSARVVAGKCEAMLDCERVEILTDQSCKMGGQCVSELGEKCRSQGLTGLTFPNGSNVLVRYVTHC